MQVSKHLALSPRQAALLQSSVRGFEVEKQPQWVPLERLSDRTEYESLRIYPEAAVDLNGTHLVPGRLSVRFNFNTPRVTSFSEGLPVHLEFAEDKAEPGRMVIKNIEIDLTKLTAGPNDVVANSN